MMTDADIRYHTPATPPEDWAETSYIYLHVPEAHVVAWIYLVARPAVGARVGYGNAQENSPLDRYTGAALAGRGW
jgi:hypothetical protein